MKKKIASIVTAFCLSLTMVVAVRSTALADTQIWDEVPKVVKVDCTVDPVPAIKPIEKYGNYPAYDELTYTISSAVYHLSDGTSFNSGKQEINSTIKTYSSESSKSDYWGGNPVRFSFSCDIEVLQPENWYMDYLFGFDESFAVSINGKDVEASQVETGGWTGEAIIPVSELENYGLETVLAPEGTIFRLFDPSNGDHIYTTSVDEKKALIAGGWKNETSPGISAGVDGVAIFRLKNEASGEHLFIANKTEKNTLSNMGWSVENGGEAVFYGAKSGKAVYRLFNPNAVSAIDSHHYTLDKNEIKVLTTQMGWVQDNDGKPVYYLN